jgi:hypothetical protein
VAPGGQDLGKREPGGFICVCFQVQKTASQHSKWLETYDRTSMHIPNNFCDQLGRG